MCLYDVFFFNQMQGVAKETEPRKTRLPYVPIGKRKKVGSGSKSPRWWQ